MEALTRVMFLLLCHVTSIAKQVTFRRDAERIDRLVSGLDGERRPPPPLTRHRAVPTVHVVGCRGAVRGRRGARCGGSGAHGALFGAVRVRVLGHGRAHVHAVDHVPRAAPPARGARGLPLLHAAAVRQHAAVRRRRLTRAPRPRARPSDRPPRPARRFLGVLLYSYYVTTLVGIANTTMDAFVATVLKQCTTQLTILR